MHTHAHTHTCTRTHAHTRAHVRTPTSTLPPTPRRACSSQEHAGGADRCIRVPSARAVHACISSCVGRARSRLLQARRGGRLSSGHQRLWQAVARPLPALCLKSERLGQVAGQVAVQVARERAECARAR
eukprot:6201640-Pleurochrysis_carterae.AAC.1